ncbi:MAG: alanine racemase, partial [Burkholderiaceae bacterium]|nr:alanine racemase [Burkholderiaceae bacterium]
MTVIEFPQHAAIDAFDVVDGELAVSGVRVSELAVRAGGRPFYAYSRDAISRRVAMLRATLPKAVHLHYAIKANPMPELVALLASLADGLDVASAGEMRVALATGTAPDRISFAGPGKTVAEITQAVAAGVTINLESQRQFEIALDAAARLGVPPQLAIRVNPTFELKSSGMKMGGGAKPFGVDEQRVPMLAARIEGEGLKLRGFHIFCGSQNLSAAALVEAQELSYQLGARLAAGLAKGIDWLNIGGGFGVPYFPGEKKLELDAIAAKLSDLCARAQREIAAPIVLELGRYLVAEAGVYVCRVLERKVSQGQTFVITDGGLHHHL